MTQNIQETWHTMKRPKLRIIWIEGGGSRWRGRGRGEEKKKHPSSTTLNIFNKIIKENFPNLTESYAYKDKNRLQNTKQIVQEKKSFLSHNTQNSKHTEQRIFKAENKDQVSYKGRTSELYPISHLRV